MSIRSRSKVDADPPPRAAKRPAAVPGREAEVNRFLAAYIMGVANRLANGASQHYRSRFNLGMSEWRTLMAIGTSRHRIVRDVAQMADLDYALVSKSLKALHTRGLVAVEQTQTRGRAAIASLTPEGLAVWKALCRSANRRHKRLAAGFSAEEIEMLWALLRRGLAQDPADRFASMDELLLGLARDPAELRRRRRRIAGLVAISAALAVVVALLVQDLHQRWQRRGREEAAARGLAATEARMTEARAAGDQATADGLFTAFVEDPLHDGTEALARAWLGEAAHRAQAGARDEARAAFASAYLTASSDALQAEALVGLVRHFHAGAESDEFAEAFELLNEVSEVPVLHAFRYEECICYS